jgi:hypothetical protein
MFPELTDQTVQWCNNIQGKGCDGQFFAFNEIVLHHIDNYKGRLFVSLKSHKLSFRALLK